MEARMKVKYGVTKKVMEEFDLALDEVVAHTVNKLSEKKKRIEKEIKAYIDGWFDNIPVLDDNMYENILEEYRTMILTSRWDRERVKHSVDEMVRRALCRESFYTFEQLVGFYKKFASVKKELYSYLPLWNAKLDKGDDSFGDFIDSIQMVHPGLATYILNSDFDGKDDLVDVKKLKKFYEKAARETACDLNRLSIPEEKLVDFWWNGENYNAFLLIQRLEEIAPHYIDEIVSLTSEAF